MHELDYLWRAVRNTSRASFTKDQYTSNSALAKSDPFSILDGAERGVNTLYQQ